MKVHHRHYFGNTDRQTERKTQIYFLFFQSLVASDAFIFHAQLYSLINYIGIVDADSHGHVVHQILSALFYVY